MFKKGPFWAELLMPPRFCVKQAEKAFRKTKGLLAPEKAAFIRLYTCEGYLASIILGVCTSIEVNLGRCKIATCMHIILLLGRGVDSNLRQLSS